MKKVIAILVCGVMIFSLTACAPSVEDYISEMSESISEYRSGKSTYLSLPSDQSIYENQEIIDFLIEQCEEMFNNGEYSLLHTLLLRLEDRDVKNSRIKSSVTTLFMEVDDVDTAYKIVSQMNSTGSYRYGYQVLEYYNSGFVLEKNSGVIASYIEANGAKEITSVPGTGYYANEENSYKRKTHGLSGSALYDATEITYKGDFKIVYEHGVKLNQYYQETKYSKYTYYFRDEKISFSLNDGEIIYSGDYLFCFDNSGKLIDHTKVE